MSRLLEVLPDIIHCQNCGQAIPPEITLWKCYDQTLCSQQCVNTVFNKHSSDLSPLTVSRNDTNKQSRSKKRRQIYTANRNYDFQTAIFIIVLFGFYSIIWILLYQ